MNIAKFLRTTFSIEHRRLLPLEKICEICKHLLVFAGLVLARCKFKIYNILSIFPSRELDVLSQQ